MGNHDDVDFAESFDLLRRQRMAQITQVRDANNAEIEDEGGALQGGAERLLVNWHIVNQNVSNRRADFFPLAPYFKPAENDRIPLRELHVVVIGMLPADGYYVGGYHRCRVHAGRNRIVDDLGSLA